MRSKMMLRFCSRSQDRCMWGDNFFFCTFLVTNIFTEKCINGYIMSCVFSVEMWKNVMENNFGNRENELKIKIVANFKENSSFYGCIFKFALHVV